MRSKCNLMVENEPTKSYYGELAMYKRSNQCRCMCIFAVFHCSLKQLSKPKVTAKKKKKKMFIDLRTFKRMDVKNQKITLKCM